MQFYTDNDGIEMSIRFYFQIIRNVSDSAAIATTGAATLCPAGHFLLPPSCAAIKSLYGWEFQVMAKQQTIIKGIEHCIFVAYKIRQKFEWSRLPEKHFMN